MGTPLQAAHALEFRTIDGWGNNQEHPSWGSAGEQLVRRYTETEYGDGIASPAGSDRPGARFISNAVSSQETPIPNDRNLTDMIWQWGQFITHDIDLTPAGDEESFPIPVPAGDPFFDPLGTGTKSIDFSRSIFDPETGSGSDNPRQQINVITSYIDASNVYGSDTERAGALRTLENGKLKTSTGNLLPFNTEGFENAPSDAIPTFFLAGDIRANEQLGLTALHTLFLREHNRLADEIFTENPDLSDEEVYQLARRTVGAQLQHITYYEFLPALLGRNFPRSRGYDPAVKASTSNVFSTVAFRGHSMISNELLRLDNEGDVIPQGNLTLHDAFFNPSELASGGGIDPLLKGLSTQLMQEVDTQAVDGLRNILFGPPGSPGMDIIAFDIQRGRDHGLPRLQSIAPRLRIASLSPLQPNHTQSHTCERAGRNVRKHREH